MKFNVEYLKHEYLDRRRSISDLAKEFGISDKLMYYYLKKYELTVKGSTTNSVVNESKFDWKKPVFCYYAGLVITDGFLDFKNNRVSVRVNNRGSKRVLRSLRWYFQSSTPVRVYSNNNDLTIHSKRLFEVLAKAGIKDKKDVRTFDKDFILSLPEINKCLFFRGMLDGDGNIHRGKFRIAMKSGKMIDALICSVNELFGFDCEMSYGSNSIKKHYYPKLEMNKNHSNIFLCWVYSDCFNNYRFDDKFEKFRVEVVKR